MDEKVAPPRPAIDAGVIGLQDPAPTPGSLCRTADVPTHEYGPLRGDNSPAPSGMNPLIFRPTDHQDFRTSHMVPGWTLWVAVTGMLFLAATVTSFFMI